MATIIFKPTEECNARCIYCDVVKKTSHAAKRMSYQTLELFFRRVGEFLHDRPSENVQLIWHGGEPLLLGHEFFERAREYQDKHCDGDGNRLRHDMQSNLTLLTGEHVAAFKRLGIECVGTSYDPEPRVRGIGPARDTAKYNRRFHESIRMLEDNGIGWGIIYVVTRKSLKDPARVFNFLSNFSNNGAFMISPVLDYGGALDDIRITSTEYADFLGAILPSWLKARDSLARVEPIYSLFNVLSGNNISLMCNEAGDCGLTHVEVTTDGRASQCGRSADWHLLDYGSIRDRSFAEIFSDPQRQMLERRNLVLKESECRGCRYWEICHGGCPLDGAARDGNFFHKTNWCEAKTTFIEKHLEPLMRRPAAPAGIAIERTEEPEPIRVREPNPVPDPDQAPVWINPVGGLGDAVMVSSVLKQVADRFPSRKFHLVERTKYREILEGHPAIAAVGYPPPGARFASTAYWYQHEFAEPGARAFQVLARMFGLDRPATERLYVPWEITEDHFLLSRIPWRSRNVLICQSSDSPRKCMPIEKWEALVELLREEDANVVQVGRHGDRPVRGAHSLLGLTTPRQLISLTGNFDVVVTSDSFLMHAARLRGVPAVVLWGPTDHRVYGYDGQVHLQSSPSCDQRDNCIGLTQADPYHVGCRYGDAHCMNTLEPKRILDAIRTLGGPDEEGQRGRSMTTRRGGLGN